MNERVTVNELAELLGVKHDAALKLIKALGIGEKAGGMWWLSLEDVEIAKNNSRTYLLGGR